MVLLKEQEIKNIIFDEEGEAIIRQQLLDSYYEGTTETKKRNDTYNNTDNK